MRWIITRANRFLGKETAYFIAEGANFLDRTTRIHSYKFKKFFAKGMNYFQGTLSSNGEAHYSTDFRRVRSEENIVSSPCWIQPYGWYDQRYSSSEYELSTQGHVYNAESAVFNTYLGPGNPYLMFIPLPTVYGTEAFQSNMPQQFLAHPNPRIDQRRYYLRRTRSSGSSSHNLDEVPDILRVLQKRVWMQVHSEKKSKKPSFEFTLMSYNVLAQDLLDEHPYLYQNHNHKSLNWKIRWKNLFNEIKTMKPDILCLQEVQQSHLNDYFRELELLGFKGLYKKRTGVRCDGCAIYYRPDRLNLVEFETVEFYQPNVAILDRDNIAIIAKLCPNGSPQHNFIVATTHLLYNPKREDVRLAQVQLLLTEVERMSFHKNTKGKAKYWPIIITGDLNTSPDSPVHTLITKGSLKYDHLAERRLDKPQSPRHGNVLMPSTLQITDQCQHAGLLQKRQKNYDMSRTEEAALIKLYNSDKTVAKTNTEIMKNPNLFSSGTLSHLFAFKSVYSCGNTENPEGTTFQDRWITVDYIFYSGKRQDDKIKESKLKLLAVFRLPLRSELGSIRIPNSLMGSDHLSLAAKFVLEI